jgi:cholesterol transport system auxiliary component
MLVGLVFIATSLMGCSPIQSSMNNQYSLDMFSAKISHFSTPYAILINLPDASAGYQTEDMRYTTEPFSLRAFSHNQWVSPPANMLQPLIVQSLQASHFFKAVAAGPRADKTDFRLDTQLIALQQDFTQKPSRQTLIVNVVLTRVDDNQVVASHLFKQEEPCPTDSPYGGVLAANHASRALTKAITSFVIAEISRIDEPLAKKYHKLAPGQTR